MGDNPKIKIRGPKTVVPTVAELLERDRLREEAKKAPPIIDGAISVMAPAEIKGEDIKPALPSKTLSSEVSRSVAQILEEFQIDPVEELLAAYNERVEDPDSPDHGKFVMTRAERVSIMKEILKYRHPTLKATEHKGSADDRSITIVMMMPDGTKTETMTEARGKVIDG
jgi:hypothetical protein